MPVSTECAAALLSFRYPSYIVYFCGARRSRRFAGIPPKIVILYVFWQSGSHFGLAAPFLFLWNNGARKSHAAQQALKVRNILSEVFVDPMPRITLMVRSLKINFGRRRKVQVAPKMITYLYKVFCLFFPTRKLFHSVFGDLYFAALNKLVYLME